jgi:hypothetical protein
VFQEYFTLSGLVVAVSTVSAQVLVVALVVNVISRFQRR